MPTPLQFFDMSVVVTPPSGHREPLPITLGPNWRPNDIRVVFVSGSGSGSGSGSQTLMMAMQSDPPTTFATAYALDQSHETHGVYYRRLQTGDNSQGVSWVKPPGWRHFMFGLLTVRGVHPTSSVTAGTLSGWRDGNEGISYITADTTTAATVSSVTVPASGTMVFFVGNVAAPQAVPWPQWPVAMGCPTGWTNLVATPASGPTYFPYDTNPSLIAVAKSFTGAGSTGSVLYPTGLGSPAFAGLYAFFTPTSDVSVSLGAA